MEAGRAPRRGRGRPRGAPAARARASVWRPTSPPATAARASRRRSAWSAASSSARPWPSLSWPAPRRSSTSSGRSSSRSRFETATRQRPTRRPTSSRVSPSSSTSSGAGARLLDRVEVLAGDVLDQRELERGGVVVRAHERRDRVAARRAARRASGARRRSARSCRRSGPTSTGCSTPRSRSESASAPSAPSSKLGAAGAGWGRPARRAPAGALRASPPRGGRQDRRQPPSHAARRLATCSDLLGELEVRVRTRAVRVVVDDGGRRTAPRRGARCAGSPCRRPVRESARVPRARRPGRARAPVVHRQHHPGNRQPRVELALNDLRVSSSPARPSSAKYSV